MSVHGTNGIAPNANRLLWAGFMAILAAGIGFAIRGGILANWIAQYKFTNVEVGDINGAGFTSFCFGIIIGGVLVDKLGYGKLVVAAFLLHAGSAVVTFMATDSMSGAQAYPFLYWGTFLFGVANGCLEAVANPLVATLFPDKRTHYLNILHASWPAGLILGGIAGAVLGEQMNWPWKWQLGLFLIPTLLYGVMFLGQSMPKSEASAKGLSLGDMMKDVGILGGLVVCVLLAMFLEGQVLGPVLRKMMTVDGATAEAAKQTADNAAQIAKFVSYGISGALLVAIAVMTKFSLGSFLLFILFIAHAMVGAVELGTDGWIQNITGVILDPVTGKWLFVYTSLIMFLLRFCADFIEKKMGLSPLGILLICAVLAAVGLNLVSMAQSTVMIMAALGVYAVGKTFFWPTMLAVVGDRFPRSGAVAMSFMGGIGMLSAGLIGSPFLGYCKDKYAGEELRKADVAVYEKYKSDKSSEFLMLPEVVGLDGGKLGEINKQIAEIRKTNPNPIEALPAEEKLVAKADIQGARSTLVADSAIPATMAVIYAALLVYFMTIGGYKPVRIEEPPVFVR